MSLPRVGLLGTGRWGANYLRALRDAAHLVAVCDISAPTRDAMKEKAPGVLVFTTIDDLLRAPLDAVIIATPTELHAAHALLALRSGKHVLVEKPLATRPHEAERLVEEAMSRSVSITVGHHLFFLPAVEKLVALVDGGRLGRITELSAVRTSSGAAHSPGSALWSLAPHDTALALRVFGELPESVETSSHDVDPAEEIRLWLRFSGGRRAVMELSRRAETTRRRVFVRGTLGWADLDEVSGQLRVAAGGESPTVWTTAPAVDPLTLQCREFARRIGRRPNEVGRDAAAAQLAVDVVRVLARADESARTRVRNTHGGAELSANDPSL